MPLLQPACRVKFDRGRVCLRDSSVIYCLKGLLSIQSQSSSFLSGEQSRSPSEFSVVILKQNPVPALLHEQNCFFTFFLIELVGSLSTSTTYAMAFNMAALARSALVLVVAVLLVATQMEAQGVFAARFSGDLAAAPAPSEDLAAAPMEQLPGLAPGTLLPGLIAPALVTMVSFWALKHL